MTLTDKQKQDIEKEAENLYPYVWPKNKEGEDFTPRPGQGAPFSNKVKKLQAAYIAGATAHALACIQKDEEIGRLTAALNHLKDVFAQRCAGDMLRMSIAQQRWVYDLILNYLKPPTTEAVKQ